MQPDGVPIIGDPSDDVARVFGDVAVDEEECRLRIRRRQRVDNAGVHAGFGPSSKVR